MILQLWHRYYYLKLRQKSLQACLRSSLSRSYSQHQKPNSNNRGPISDALQDGSAASSSLLAPVHIPEDPQGVLKSSHPAAGILSNPSLIMHRQLEMMNVMLGFEQANRYVALDPQGSHIGFLAERELGMGNVLARQMLRTHRAFTTHVFDRAGREVLRFHRPFSWINSTIRVFDPVDPTAEGPASSWQQGNSALTDQSTNLRPSLMPLDHMKLIGQAQQEWALLRRRYNLWLARHSNVQSEDIANTPSGLGLEQFAYIDEPFLSWDFALRQESGAVVGSINRNFAGFGRELFTDTGVYALRMDAAAVEAERKDQAVPSKANKNGHAVEILPPEGSAMSLDQRAVMLAMAVSVDFDYFSRSRGGFFGFPMPLWMGGAPAEGAAAGEAAGAAAGIETATGAGAVEGTGTAGSVARGTAGGVAADGAAGGIAGAGTMAGYEAMQRGIGRRPGGVDDASPQAQPEDLEQHMEQQKQQHSQEQSQEEVWGNNSDPWGGDQGGGGSEGGGGDGDGWGDFF